MVVQAGSEISHYWSKYLTDIPFVLILALGIFLWRRANGAGERSAALNS